MSFHCTANGWCVQELRSLQAMVRSRKITETSNVLKKIMQGERVVPRFHEGILAPEDSKSVSCALATHYPGVVPRNPVMLCRRDLPTACSTSTT